MHDLCRVQQNSVTACTSCSVDKQNALTSQKNTLAHKQHKQHRHPVRPGSVTLSTEQEVPAVTEFCCTLHRSCIFFVGQARGASRPRVRPGQTLVRGCLCLLAPEPMPGVGWLALPATMEGDRLGVVGSGPMHRSSALVGLVGDCLLLSVRGVGIAFCRPSTRVLCRSGTSPLLGAARR